MDEEHWEGCCDAVLSMLSIYCRYIVEMSINVVFEWREWTNVNNAKSRDLGGSGFPDPTMCNR